MTMGRMIGDKEMAGHVVIVEAMDNVINCN